MTILSAENVVLTIEQRKLLILCITYAHESRDFVFQPQTLKQMSALRAHLLGDKFEEIFGEDLNKAAPLSKEVYAAGDLAK